MEVARPAGTRAAAPGWFLAAAFVAGGAGVLAAVAWLVAVGALLVWVVPAALAGAVALWAVRPGPLARLVSVAGLQAFQLGGAPGLSAGEVVAGLALVLYLGHWYAHAALSARPVLTSGADVAAAGWLGIAAPAAVGLGLLFGADPYDFRADLLATLPFALYFPVKDACARDQRGALAVAAVLGWLGTVAVLTNALRYRAVIASADAVWEIADARFITGETSITAALLLSLAALATARFGLRRVVLAVATAGFVGGIVITKSRGFWVSALLGILFLGVVLPGSDRRRLVAWGGAGLVVLVGASVLVLGDQLALIAYGTVQRFATLATAATQDVSLVNRFWETSAAVDMALENPVLGYGWGVQVTRFNIIYGITETWAFLHNGYVALWLKTGLWGLALMMTVWVGGIFRATWAGRGGALGPTDRALALGAAATLVAFTLVANSSNPFSILDQMLVVTLLLGLTNGLADRAGALRRARS